MIRAVIFDLDGTLIDSAVAISIALNQLARARGKPAVDIAEVRRWVSLGAADLVGHALGGNSTEQDIAEFRRLYRALPPDPKDLYPHVLETLAVLAARGLALGICTNKPEDLARSIVAGTGLGASIKTIVGGRADRQPKPDTAPLFETLRLMNAAAPEAVYVGDSEVDAETAAAAGLPFYLVSYGYAIGDANAIRAQARIDDFRQLPDVLKI